ncbi:OmpA family protein [Hymenobacter sp. ASUV-10]|uniref:OmpA family protein n=1 Tax=Hymenobacter aranciens TaxID=3063996 RepID=A0ABT9BF22_9BACT|nr:OmpA family protein [Hymenobacter sp. ASUV-10]MDO7876855.1 OmpA family protein [Hymenobacter sp. ASUV-10]
MAAFALALAARPAAVAQPTAALVPTVLLDERFADNSNSWIVGSDDTGDSKIDTLAGTYTLRRPPEGGSFITQTLGVNYDADFSIDVELRGTGGLVWGYTKGSYNTLELTAAGQWLAKRVLNSTATTLKQGALTAPADWHRLRVARVVNELQISVDDKLVHQQAWEAPAGKKVGFVARGPGGELVLRRLRVQHRAAPIQLAPNLPAGLKRERLGPPVSDPALADVGPVVSADGKRIFFHRVISKVSTVNANVSDKDVYLTERRPDGSWGPAQSLGRPINNEASNAPAWTSPDGRELLLISRYNADGSYLSRSGLSRSRQQPDGSWSIPEVAVERKSDFPGQRVSYTFDAGSTLRVYSKQLDSRESPNSDLYVEFRQPDGSYGPARALGPVLNTPLKDISPFLAPDGVTLYFASNGHPGYGHLDIFVSRRLDDSWTSWSPPLNLGPAVNTNGDESFFTLAAAGDYAYFSATGPAGNLDLYRIALPPALAPKATRLVRGRVLNARTGEPIGGADIAYEQLPGGQAAGTVAAALGTGRYKIVLPAGRQFGFRASAAVYLSVNENVDLTSLTRYGEVEQDLLLLPLMAPVAALAAAPVQLAGGTAPAAVPGQVKSVAVPAPKVPVEEKITLNNLFFVQSQPKLLPASFPELNRLAQTLREHPGLRLRLEGHTDNVGDDKNPRPNQFLSEQRAEAVRNYLLGQGIAAERLSTAGYGGSRPAVPNTTEASRRRNRRVECVVLAR